MEPIVKEKNEKTAKLPPLITKNLPLEICKHVYELNSGGTVAKRQTENQ